MCVPLETLAPTFMQNMERIITTIFMFIYCQVFVKCKRAILRGYLLIWSVFKEAWEAILPAHEYRLTTSLLKIFGTDISCENSKSLPHLKDRSSPSKHSGDGPAFNVRRLKIQ